MEFFNKLTDRIDDYVSLFTERFNNRFIFSLGLTWILWNWEIIYYFFQSLDSVDLKILWIKSEHTLEDFCYPLSIALLYSSSFPLVRNTLDFLWTGTDKLTKWLIYNYIDKKTFLTTEDRRRLLTDMNNQSKKHKEEIKSLEATLISYKNLLTSEEVEKNPLAESDNIEDLTQEELNTNNSFDDIGVVKKLFVKEDSIYLIKKWIADNLKLSRDNAIHKKEVEIIFDILKSIADTSPSPWKIREFNTAHGKQSLQQVAAFLIKLKNVFLVEEKTQNVYELSKDAMNKFGYFAKEISLIK